KIGRTKVFEGRVGVVLRVDFGIRAPEEGVGVIILAAVIGQRLSRYLTSGYPAAVGKCGDEERVDRGALLTLVEHLRNALVGEGDGSNLDADHLFLRCRIRRDTRTGQRRCD